MFFIKKIHDYLAKPTTETGTEHEVTKRPTILTTLSSIASVTIDTELPVPMETLNMSDYKQGKLILYNRLIPARIKSSSIDDDNVS